MLGGELGQEVGRGLAYALAQAPGGRPEPPPLHLRGDLLSPSGEPAPVAVRAVRLPAAGTLVPGRPGDLVGLKRRASR